MLSRSMSPCVSAANSAYDACSHFPLPYNWFAGSSQGPRSKSLGACLVGSSSAVADCSSPCPSTSFCSSGSSSASDGRVGSGAGCMGGLSFVHSMLGPGRGCIDELMGGSLVHNVGSSSSFEVCMVMRSMWLDSSNTMSLALSIVCVWGSQIL